MAVIPQFKASTLETLSNIIGETTTGLTNAEIHRLLLQAQIEDVVKPGIMISKHDRLYAAFVKEIQCLPTRLRACILAFLEITIGIHEISILEISGMVKYLCAIPLLSFGGLCTAMQTWSVCMGAPFSMRNYIKVRLLFALISGLLTILYFFILY